MTFAAVGSLIQATSASFSLTPQAVGDLILLQVHNLSNATVYATAASSSNVTWSSYAHYLGSANTNTATVFAGKVTSASVATVTFTWSGAAPATVFTDGQEFSSTAGAWVLDTSGHVDTKASNSTWASLTPAGPGELYFGYCTNPGTAVAGSTSGYTYDVDAQTNGVAFNPACTSAVQAPVWGDTGQDFGLMVLVRETPSFISPRIVSQAVNRAGTY